MILVCNVDPFRQYQDIYLVNDEGNENSILSNVGQMELTSLYSFVPSYCHRNDIEKVKICGNTAYNQGVKDQIEMVEKTQFSNNKKLIVEVV